MPEQLKKAQRLVFFDIETTGLSAYSSSLYLIGALAVSEGQARFYQWFAPSLSCELPVLRAFFSFLRPGDLLVSFNGDTFDRNYLEACAKQYSEVFALQDHDHVDLLKKIRKHKAVFGLPGLRQKAVERFLGIEREDRYTGGELISVYENYSASPDDRLLHLLLLHNEEDVLGMPALLPMLYYTDLLESPGSPEEVYRNKSGSMLYLSYRSAHAFPKELRYEDPSGISCVFSGERLTLSVPLFHGELRYFFPNFRDYYYLPVEDRAIHKKLGRFVEKEYRVQAGPDTCFTKRTGFYVPALPGCGLPCYREDYGSKDRYHFLEEDGRFPEDYGSLFLSTL